MTRVFFNYCPIKTFTGTDTKYMLFYHSFYIKHVRGAYTVQRMRFFVNQMVKEFINCAATRITAVTVTSKQCYLL